jgi:hypothetical protein
MDGGSFAKNTAAPPVKGSRYNLAGRDKHQNSGGMTVSLVLGLTVPLPAIIGAFFTGGVSGIFGNALGGRRGACIGGFIYGLICIIPVALFYPL